MLRHPRNPVCGLVVPFMNPINEVHVQEPGLAVIDIETADAATALALQDALASQWATATADQVTHTGASQVYGCAATWTYASRLVHRGRRWPVTARLGCRDVCAPPPAAGRRGTDRKWQAPVDR
nr:DUF6207 family protein [Streptomyces sp. RP5T]